MRLEVMVRLRFEGVHCWPDCPLDGVSFLKSPHRHEFHVEARTVVSHEERQVEIIMLKRGLEEYCRAVFRGPHTMSCETMARKLVERFGLSSCAVLEDGENGSVVTA